MTNNRKPHVQNITQYNYHWHQLKQTSKNNPTKPIKPWSVEHWSTCDDETLIISINIQIYVLLYFHLCERALLFWLPKNMSYLWFEVNASSICYNFNAAKPRNPWLAMLISCKIYLYQLLSACSRLHGPVIS